MFFYPETFPFFPSSLRVHPSWRVLGVFFFSSLLFFVSFFFIFALLQSFVSLFSLSMCLVFSGGCWRSTLCLSYPGRCHIIALSNPLASAALRCTNSVSHFVTTDLVRTSLCIGRSITTDTGCAGCWSTSQLKNEEHTTHIYTRLIVPHFTFRSSRRYQSILQPACCTWLPKWFILIPSLVTMSLM